MTPERWQRIAALYESAMERAPGERSAFVRAATGDDADLRSQVESLMAQSTRVGPLDQPIWDVAATVVGGGRLAIGACLGPYRVDALIGVGGMGEVYRAHDMTLGRSVALKVLPASFADDGERLARFEREARVLASLNHPHIATIHALESSTVVTGSDAAEVRALVLELVEGSTLAERLAEGTAPTTRGLAIDEALAIARQIADALEAAHEQGIVHRDLKPANIKIRIDGTVKVLDFGLSKFTQVRPGPKTQPEPTQSPTITTPAMTALGIILGTAAYMSPEQARGREADKRSDIWAFGCVLYEMLTGRRAFEGNDTSDTLAAVLRAEPDWSALPETLPLSIRRLLRRTLEKDRRRRLADMADARLEIEEASSSSSFEQTPPAAATHARRTAWITAGALAGLSAFLAVLLFRAASPPTELRVELWAPPTSDPTSMAISPDGEKVVYVAGETSQHLLWVRFLKDVDPHPIEGTDGASSPFWFPDSRSIGFTTADGIKRTEVSGGSVRPLTTLHGGDATINANGVVLVEGGTDAIRRIDPGATASIGATRVERPGQSGHRVPRFLPDGRHFLFYAAGPSRGVYVGELGTLDAVRVFDADSGAVFASSGHLLFARSGVLLAQAFDPDRLELRGEPIEIARQLAIDRLGTPAVSVSATGRIAYRTSTVEDRAQFKWFDRSGRELQTLGEPLVGTASFSLSQDGRRVALQMTTGGNADIWLLDTVRGFLSPLTVGKGLDRAPVWSPDGRRVAYESDQAGRRAIVSRAIESTGEPEVLSQQPGPLRDWSPDGRHILYVSESGVWALPLFGDRKTFRVTDSSGQGGQFSPDGQWVAYSSNESGRVEIYVQPFPGPGAKRRVSTNGGTRMRWNPKGGEIFYVAPNEELMSVRIRLDSSRQVVEAGEPMPLFKTNLGDPAQPGFPTPYVVSPDGERFLMRTVSDVTTSPLRLILDWKPRM